MVNKRLIIFSVVIFLLICFASTFVFAIKLPAWFPFNKEKALEKWKEKVFKGKVLYSVKVKGSESYLSAHSDQASSGIFYRIVFSPRTRPMVSWKWRVMAFPSKGKAEHRQEDEEAKEGWIERDDYAARFYVIFPGLSFKGTRCLEYVWDKNLPEGKVLTSPYFTNIKIFVVESGDRNLGKWVLETRNICEDYQKVFNTKAPKVGALAIMTDSDNTLSTAEAHYKEIKVGYEEDEK